MQSGVAQNDTDISKAADLSAKEQARVLNDLFVDTFNSVMRIEERSLESRLTKGLTIAEIHTIDAVGLHEKNPVKVVAERLGVTLATATTAISKLEKKGVVVREKGEQDRRQVLVSLTLAGRKAWRAHSMFHQKLVEQALSPLAPEESRVLMLALGKVKEYFDDQYEAPWRSQAASKNNG